MRNDVVEANVVMSKCQSSHEPYGIRIEKRTNNVWYCTWAFKISEKSAGNEGYSTNKISGRVEIDSEYPGCICCKSTGWVVCGRCGKLTCSGEVSKGNTFVCAWCGNRSDNINTAEEFDLSAGGY